MDRNLSRNTIRVPELFFVSLDGVGLCFVFYDLSSTEHNSRD